MRQCILMLFFAVTLPFALKAQAEKDTSSAGLRQPATNVSEKSLRFINKKYGGITDAVDKQTVKMLEGMQRKEARLQKKLQCVDSLKAQQLFTNVQANYQKLQAQLQSPLNSTVANPLKQYLPGIDSTATLMHFLSGSSIIPSDKLAQIQGISSQVQQLQGRLQQANDAQQFVQEREQQLKDQLSQYDMGKQLLGMNKQVYYYQQQLQQYKDLINDKEKLEQAIIEKVRELPAFQSFWQRNSILSQLFPMPGSSTGASANAVTGLQTRTQIQDMIATRIPSVNTNADAGSIGPNSGGGSDPSQLVQQQMQDAQTQLNTLKDKLSQLGAGSGSSNTTVPDFTPNNQHNKSFLKRLTFGYNFQTAPATGILPATCNIGLSLGYKLSDKATIGTGVSYLLGMGQNFSNIAFTNQGVGLRSFVDIKAKGSIWVTGGYEYNYMQVFAKLSDLRNVDAWQKSALLGLTKKYTIGKKEGNMQLLYDFLAEREIPAGRPLVFRIGYSF